MIVAVFVGGPLDGEKHALEQASATWAVLEQPPPIYVVGGDDVELDPVRTTYRRVRQLGRTADNVPVWQYVLEALA